VTLKPVLDTLAAREHEVHARAEQLRGQIEELAAALADAEQELDHLRITRQTMLALADQIPQPPAAPPALPDNPAYQQILAVFAQTTGPLRARDLCQALDLGFQPNHIEGVRSKLKRLVKLGVLYEPEAGQFTNKQP
jgi:hypothetical protein